MLTEIVSDESVRTDQGIAFEELALPTPIRFIVRMCVDPKKLLSNGLVCTSALEANRLIRGPRGGAHPSAFRSSGSGAQSGFIESTWRTQPDSPQP